MLVKLQPPVIRNDKSPIKCTLEEGPEPVSRERMIYVGWVDFFDLSQEATT